MAKETLAKQEREAPTQVQSAITSRSNGGLDAQTLRNIGLIIQREFKNRVERPSFMIGTVIMLVLIIIGISLPTIISYFAASSNAQTKLAIVNNAGPVAGLNGDALTGYFNANLNGTAVPQTGSPAPAQAQQPSEQPRFVITAGAPGDIPTLQKQVRSGSLSMLLVLERAENRDVRFITYTASSNRMDTTTSQLQAIAGQLSQLDKASRLGLTPEQTRSLFASPDFRVVHTAPTQDTRSEGERIVGYFLGMAGVILIFMAIFLYGVSVAQGVAEEKGHRIMEILVNAATPFQLMTGKIIGIGAAGLLQMTLLVIAGIGALLVQAPLSTALLSSRGGGFSLTMSSATLTMILLVLVYFLLGYLLFSTLFAAAGAMVSRQEEVQNTIQPLTWLFMIGYMASFFGPAVGEATWIKVMSLVPFWTPTMMLMRLATGTVAWWEIALSVVLMLVASFFCALLAARIYRFGILMYGQKLKFSQFFKLARAQ
ncbi:MAG: ABC transporter permease [Ktedonobacteraceae bacterium]|nr:ABC transporter permease [Ktedonobacteraceae bacterium]